MTAPGAGSAVLKITPNINNVQVSNYHVNSFIISNTGSKNIAQVEIDVTSALYPDTVFDPFGLAGDTVFKALTINTNGNTGVAQPDSSSYIGIGGTAGYEGIRLLFNSAMNGGFNPGESVGFSIDMDPNSIRGTKKSPLDGGTSPKWDVGGVSGAELIGSAFTVTFADGTTATGYLQGDNSQAGAQALASQDHEEYPDLPISLTVNGLVAGGTGFYSSSGPTVIVNGPIGRTARVVLTKGFIQPNAPYSQFLEEQLSALAASPFPANNAVEFQTRDIILTGANQDISSLFDFSGVANYDFPGEDKVPLGFVASAIDPANGNLPIGPATPPIYLQYIVENVVSVLPTLQASEPSTNGQFTVSLSQPASTNTIVSYSVSGSATPGSPGTAGADYTALSGSVTIPVNQTTASINVQVLDDSINEGTETVVVNLTGVSGGAGVVLGDNTQATVNIADNDQPVSRLVIEAENADTITNYRIQSVSAASGQQVLGLLGGSENESGSATFIFDEAAGNYDITIGAFDESDGVSTFTASLKDFETGVTTVFSPSILLDQDLGSSSAVSATKVTRKIVSNVKLTPGDQITITGVENGTEHALLDTIEFSPLSVAPPNVLYRVNAGGREVAALATDPVQMAWAANPGKGATIVTPAGVSLNTGNLSSSSIATQLKDTSLVDYLPYAVFGSERWDAGALPEMEWNFAVTPGATYEVNLFLRDGFSGTSTAGQRIFDVEIEGIEFFSDVDLSASYGPQVGGMLSQQLTVADDSLDIKFLHQVQNPLINAIEIIQLPDSPPAPLPVVDIVFGDQTVNENEGTANISILSSSTVPSSETIDILFKIEPLGTATAGPNGDYQYLSSSAVFGGGVYTDTKSFAGSSSDLQIPILINNDNVFEGAEAFKFTILSVSPNAVLGSKSDATITIVDDDGVIPTPTTVRIQAEDFDASVVYGVQNQNAAEGGQVAFLPSGGASGSATYDLAAKGVAAGFYNLTIGYFDENDGVSDISVTVDGTEIGTFTLDDDATSGNGAQSASFRTTTLPNVTVGENGELVIAATTDGGEFARIDWIEFVPAGDPQPPALGEILFRVNAGGPEVASTDGGPAWGQDQSNANSANLIAAGSNTTTGFAVVPGASVPDTVPAELFLTERWDKPSAPSMQWGFDVAPGSYLVNLYMGNGFGGTSGADQREFDVAIEGVVPANLDDVDLSEQLGHLVGGVFSNVVDVTDGQLNIEFLHGVNNPLINAIEIIAVVDSAPIPLIASLDAPSPAGTSVAADAGASGIDPITGLPVTSAALTPSEPSPGQTAESEGLSATSTTTTSADPITGAPLIVQTPETNEPLSITDTTTSASSDSSSEGFTSEPITFTPPPSESLLPPPPSTSSSSDPLNTQPIGSDPLDPSPPLVL